MAISIALLLTFNAKQLKETLIGLNNGVYDYADFKELQKFFNEHADEIKQQFSTLKKDDIFKVMGAHFRYTYGRDYKKPQIVNAAYENLFTWMLVTDETLSYSYDPFAEKKEENPRLKALNNLLNRITPERYEQARKECQKHKAERDAEKQAQIEAHENAEKDPQTEQEFKIFLQNKINEGLSLRDARLLLTEEQRERFDLMVAKPLRQSRVEALEEKRRRLFVAEQKVNGQIVETTHTKKGHDLYVVQLEDRVSRDDYNKLNASAKRLGGYYSSYRRDGAVPGFQFTERENAEAFQSLVAGDSGKAEEKMHERLDVYKDNRSQTAVERLREMAWALDEKANQSLNQERKTNTARRASFAASAEASANSDIALAETMNKIADKIENNEAQFLDQIRMKVQVEFLKGLINAAKHKELLHHYPYYGEREKHTGEPATLTTIEFLSFPFYKAERGDLARMGREMIEVKGLKKLGAKLLKVSDDNSKDYEKFAKDNLTLVAKFQKKSGGMAAYSRKRDAEEALEYSGFKGKAIPLSIKRGEWLLVLSATEAKRQGIWDGNVKEMIQLSPSFASELIDQVSKHNANLNASQRSIFCPWGLELSRERRKRLSTMGIESPVEMRCMLREFLSLNVIAKKPDPIKEMERTMVGRCNDGLDFFPTPLETAQTLIDYAEISEGMSVLEPSAGMGHIADQIREAGFEPDVCEISFQRRELLALKGFNIVEFDFLELTETYDRIIMNPPFSDRRDSEHVQHAYSLLKPGGRLVAIVGEGVFFGSDKRAKEFRDWVELVGGSDEALEENTFMDANLPVNTGVNARILVIDKAVEVQQEQAA